jgi:hypothetical protein
MQVQSIYIKGGPIKYIYIKGGTIKYIQNIHWISSDVFILRWVFFLYLIDTWDVSFQILRLYYFWNFEKAMISSN